MEYRFELDDVAKTIQLGEIIGNNVFPNLVIALSGDLGAGKTTLTKGIARGMGISKNINSPTFTIMKVYEGPIALYHLDVYRITDENSDFELEEYFYLNGCAVVEWANNIKGLLPSDAVGINLTVLSETKRLIEITTSNGEWLSEIRKKVKDILC